MITEAEVHAAKILIVDDIRANVMLLDLMLKGAGYTSITSTMDSRGVKALHALNQYDLILLDLQMPGLNGFQVMESLKEVEKGSYLPVLVITSQPDLMVRALQAGAKDFVSKPFELSELLVRVYNMVEVRLLHRESRLLYEKMVEQQKISERLLLNVLPHTIAEQLKVRSTGSTVFSEVIAESFSEATVLFADIVEFTKVSARLSPRQLVVPLNEVFTSFDRIADNRGLEKIKTNGDSYMAVAGVPVSVSDHAARAAHAALDMLSAVDYFNMRTGNNLQVRIGLNSGPSVAGVIGQSKFIYDVWGEAVNVASQMESHGVAGRVQVTESTMRQLGEHFLFEPRGTIELKGRGPVDTWFLVGRRHNNSVRPTTLSG